MGKLVLALSHMIFGVHSAMACSSHERPTAAVPTEAGARLKKWASS